LPAVRILHLITDPRRRGAQIAAADLHEELLRRGHRSRLVALSDHQDAPPDSTVRVLGRGGPGGPPGGVLGGGRFGLPALRALRGAAAGGDVVVAHGSSTLPACALALAGTGTPFVYVNIGDPRHWTASRARRLRVGAGLRRAAAVASVSPGSREVLLERFGLSPRQVTAIPNGRPAERFRPADGPEGRLGARRQFGLSSAENAELVGFVGSLTPEKRVDLAIDAVAALDGVHLAVAGEGPLHADLERRARAAAPGRVHFLGTVADTAAVYRACDALVLSSDSEGVPGVLVEAALAGVPAAATEVGWVADVVLDGSTGALVPPGDAEALAGALRTVLTGRARLGVAAREHALKHYELTVTADAWEALLASFGDRNGR
jgi:glycosyltransferase involved in cell wall biosynthesis